MSVNAGGQRLPHAGSDAVLPSLHRNEEGEEQLRLRRLHLPFNFATGEAVLYDTMPGIEVPNPCSPAKKMKVDSDSVSPHSLLGCLLNQDQAAYRDQNTITSLSDLAFQDSHATFTIPRDASAKPAVSSPLVMDSTTEDMLETLQQILGEAELMEEVEVGPEELKSWESTLLNFTSSEIGDNLNEVLCCDVLSYVEEQLRKEGGNAAIAQLQNQGPGQEQQNFGWASMTYNQMTFKGGVMMEGQAPAGRGGMKLSHMDFPLEAPSGFNSRQNTSPASLPCGGGASVTFNPSQTDLYPQTDDTSSKQGAFPPKLSSFCPFAGSRFTQTPHEGLPVQNQSTAGQLHSALGCHGNPWSSTSGTNISNQPAFSAGRSAQNSQNSQNHRQSWLPGADPQLAASLTRMPPSLVNTVDMSFRTPETLPQPFLMLVNGPHPDGTRPNKASASPTPSKPSCLYQARPGGGSVPPPMVMQNPLEAVLPCQMEAGHNVNGLMGAPQELLGFSELDQVKSQGGVQFFLTL